MPRHMRPGRGAAGQRHRFDARVLDDALHGPTLYQQAAEHTFRQASPRKASSIASEHCGTLEACLSTAVLPAMSAGAAKRNTCQKGKFQGIIASTTPSGSKAT